MQAIDSSFHSTISWTSFYSLAILASLSFSILIFLLLMISSTLSKSSSLPSPSSSKRFPQSSPSLKTSLISLKPLICSSSSPCSSTTGVPLSLPVDSRRNKDPPCLLERGAGVAEREFARDWTDSERRRFGKGVAEEEARGWTEAES